MNLVKNPPEAVLGETLYWNDFQVWNGQVAGRDCRIVVPPIVRTGQPWVWKAEFFDAFPVADIELVNRGFHLCYVDVSDHYGCPKALEYGDAFYKVAVGQFGLGSKPGFIALSRGGLFAYNWAIKYPDRVGCIYADNPVCDIKSWPAGWGMGPGSPEDWKKCLKVYGLNKERANYFKGNPVDKVHELIRAEIPILHVIGLKDEIVPVSENSDRIRDAYKASSGPYEEIVKSRNRHHPHGLKDPSRIVQFFERYL